MQNPILQDLLNLSHELGREDRGLAMLGEGNTSARLTEDTFLVKASGTCLGTLEGRGHGRMPLVRRCCPCWRRRT